MKKHLQSTFFILFALISLFGLGWHVHADSLVVRVGVEDNLPLQSISNSAQPEGLVLYVLRYIAGEEDWRLEFISFEWASCLEMLENGEIDLLGGIAYSEARAQRFDFSSEALITNWGVVCVNPNSQIDTILDLQDRSIAMLPDDIYTLAFQDLMQSFGIEFAKIEVGTYAQALEAIQAGDADAGVVSRLFATQNAGDYDVIPSTVIFNPTEIRYAATKGKHAELLQAIDSNLIALKENPNSYYYQALSKWFGGGSYHEVPSWVGWLLSFTGWAIIIFLIAMFSLRRQVQARTAELAEGYQQLQVEFAERRKAELALRDLNEQLEQRVEERTAQLENVNKELEAFAYSVSHDLRSPVRAIEAYSDIILSEYSGDLTEEARFYQERIRANATEMDKLIEAILVFSRLNRQTLTKEPVDPTAIAQQVVADLAHVQHPNMAIIVEPMPICSADLILLKQVYANLIGNAVKFSQEKPEPRILVGCKEELNEIVYFVQDNGVGFDMEIKERLFEAFKRLHAADEYEGHGIGLAMVQRIVQRHGGRVWAESVQGEGATFYFTLR